MIAVVLGLDYYGVIWHNSPIASKYSVKGLDVSHYQGEIDWNKVRETKEYAFAYIKATEGHDFVDDKFQTNWEGAKKNSLSVGAYHFFSMRSSGHDQAQEYIRTVPRNEGTLPPALDIEINMRHDPVKARAEISIILRELENHFGKKPIIYVTYESYNAFIKNSFSEYPIWIRDIIKYPNLGNRDWLIWQYNNRGLVPGIKGHVDINVFNGDEDEYEDWLQGS